MKAFVVDHLYSHHFKFSSKMEEGIPALVFILGSYDKKKIENLVKTHAHMWQAPSLTEKRKDILHFAGQEGPVWIVSRETKSGRPSHQGFLEESDYAWMRDQMAGLLSQLKSYDLDAVQVQMMNVNKAQTSGVLVGLNLAAYSFKSALMPSPYSEFPEIYFSRAMAKDELRDAQALSQGLIAARHLVNLPPNILNPETMAESVKKYFSGKKTVRVEVWEESRLKKENMGLMLGVGGGSRVAPRLVHIRYRPAGAAKKKPIALVGKGITFDSGGLDIKPSSGMRLMKKDMGGSAATLGLAVWAEASRYGRPLDFYLALAENSVDANSMRPSDVLVARNGLNVEIHNTDAEGRLVLGDALDVAVSQKGKDEPEMVLDFATLTGACRVALGTEIAGLFSNNDKLADDLQKAGVRAGDLSWRLPLFPKYTKGFDSPFADVVNATDGMGGAITAALFLEKFVRAKAWAHLDTYAWGDKVANGQPVQAVVEFLKSRA